MKTKSDNTKKINKIKKNSTFRSTKLVIRKSRFEVRCEEIKGHIFDCTDLRQADKLITTIKKIGEYVTTNLKYGSDIQYVIENYKNSISKITNLKTYLKMQQIQKRKSGEERLMNMSKKTR